MKRSISVYCFIPLFVFAKLYHKFKHWIDCDFMNEYLQAKLRFYHAELGKNIQFNGNTSIQIAKDAKIKIGRDFLCNSGERYAIDINRSAKICVQPYAELIIGKHSGMTNSVIQCHKKIVIGDYVNIGAGCMIFDTNFHSTDWHIRENRVEDANEAKTSPVSIGDHVFVGTRSIICKGVNIGEKSLIAAGSVVTKDIPPYCIAGGNPCRVIKYLETEDLRSN